MLLSCYNLGSTEYKECWKLVGSPPKYIFIFHFLFLISNSCIWWTLRPLFIWYELDPACNYSHEWFTLISSTTPLKELVEHAATVSTRRGLVFPSSLFAKLWVFFGVAKGCEQQNCPSCLDYVFTKSLSEVERGPGHSHFVRLLLY